MHTQRERANPRMSLNKLGEYLTAAMPGRRRTIIKEQRKPKDFIVARYAQAEQAIKEYFTTHKPSTDQLRRAIASLSAMAHRESWEGQNADLCNQGAHFLSQHCGAGAHQRLYGGGREQQGSQDERGWPGHQRSARGVAHRFRDRGYRGRHQALPREDVSAFGWRHDHRQHGALPLPG